MSAEAHVDWDNLTATELMAQARAHKATDLVIYKGKKMPIIDVVVPIMRRYLLVYVKKELREIAGGDGSGAELMDITEQVSRHKRIFVLLSQPVPSVSALSCITLSVDGFNVAYLYVSISKTVVRTMYISLGDSIQSCDGEWRSLLTNYDAYDATINEHMSAVEKIVAAYPAREEVDVHIFYNTKIYGDALELVREHIELNVYKERLVALAWFVGRYEREYYGQVPMSKVYAKFLESRSSSARDVVSTIGKSAARKIYATLGALFDREPEVKNRHDLMARVGQKLIQLTPDEVNHPLNADFQAWREVEITRKTSDLVLNMVCPGFAMHSIWFFIYEATSLLYNLDTSRERMAISETIRLTPNDMRTDKVLSNMAICMINEHCGPTLRAIINEQPSSSAKAFNKYIFEVIYALLCMHARLGVAHCDLHCDNATVASMADGLTKGSHVVYRINGESYAFQHDGTYGCIIDFSRAMYMSSIQWIERVIDKYSLHFSEPTPMNKDAFDARIYGAIDDEKKMSELAKVLSAFDIYEFADSLLNRCEASLGPKIVKLLSDIKVMAKRMLLDVLSQKNMMPAEWAAQVVLRAMWKPTLAADIKPESLVGIYTFDNALRYSIMSYETLPRSMNRTPLMRDPKDTPVESNRNISLKSHYRVMEEEEALLRSGAGQAMLM
jgi:hypothetical protein